MPSNNLDAPILITGASGFVGLHLVEHLQSVGFTNIHGTSLDQGGVLAESLGSDHIHVVNLTESEAVFELIGQVQPKWVFHLAALAFVGESFTRGLEVMENNLKVQFIMLEAIRQHCPTARILSVSSAYVYGMLPSALSEKPIAEDAPFYPNNPYAVSKVTQDMLALSYALSYQLDVVRVRPFNQIGPRQTGDFAIPAFAQQIIAIERGEASVLKVGNLSAVRDFTDVRDAVMAYHLLMERGVAGEAYNLGSGQGRALSDVVEQMRQLARVPISVEVEESRLRPVDVPVFVANIEKIRALGWEPRTPFSQTLSDILEYARK